MAMDSIVKPSEREFISPLINFNKFKMESIAQRDNLRSVVGLNSPRQFQYPNDIPDIPKHIRKRKIMDDGAETSSTISDDLVKFAEFFGFRNEQVNDIANQMSLEKEALMNNRGILFRRRVELDDIPSDTQLETLKIKRNVLEGFNPIKKRPVGNYGDPSEHARVRKSRAKIIAAMAYEGTVLKYNDFFENELKRSRLTNGDTPVVNDIVVTLVINRPYNHILETHEKRSLSVTPYWKFLLRGDTTLLDVHGLFRCSADFGAHLDSEQKVPHLYDFNMVKYPSSFIFIHDTFYVPDAYRALTETMTQLDVNQLEPMDDISEPIRKWMSKKKSFGKTYVKDIANVKIKDLICRLGYPYVYVHQGQCEHVFFFTDLRLMDSFDYPIGYPMKLSDTSAEHYCITCHKRIAKWIVESESFPVIPAHMCDDCYRSFHYVHKLRRPVNSKAYIYEDPSMLQF